MWKSSLSRTMVLWAFVAFIGAIFAVPHVASAVLPPDIIFAVSSQVVQLWTFVGTIIVGSIVVLFPTFTIFFKSKVGKWLCAMLGVIVVLLVWSYVLLHIYRPASLPPWVPNGTTATGTTTGAIPYKVGYRFYSDRFVFVGKRPSGDPVAFDMYINRKELADGGFFHYYSLSLIDGNIRDENYQSQMVPDSEVLPGLIFSEFVRHMAADHSSRESFTFSLSGGNKKYALETSELKGDFITKNEPENTEYFSVGRAILRNGTDSIEGNVLFQRTYSTDYRPTIFFAGYETLSSEATQIILWDDAGSFYLADKSDVHTVSPAYSSHFWALTKDGDRARKAFSGELELSQNVTGLFTGSIPDLGIKEIRVTAKTFFFGETTKGYTEGTLVDSVGSHAVRGIVTHNEYGER